MKIMYENSNFRAYQLSLRQVEELTIRIMNLNNPLFIIPATTGPLFMIFGIIIFKFPPRTINALYGYRTSNSMKSQERWDFAQFYSAKEMIKLGAALALTSFTNLFYNPPDLIGTAVGLGLLFTLVITLVVKTERALTNRFGKT